MGVFVRVRGLSLFIRRRIYHCARFINRVAIAAPPFLRHELPFSVRQRPKNQEYLVLER